ncbi:hypothetical protein HMN09_00047100 [Mycena chlorophos]|uniref:Uncharacterized protein n=1 Tax=Mycena chlorophos TaxID=658473 RepID=A0A8H6WPU6_MYCCL|nr:hypothetical protein HMN09_00047100 [Mycena chlorophos]
MSAMLYDTHMADYAPGPAAIDIDMGHNAWFDAAETHMEDDQNHFSDHESTQSVEVDMEGEYTEGNEYEMADEELYEEMSADFVDIEVLEPLQDATLLPAEPDQAFVVEPIHDKASFVPSPLPLADAELPDASVQPSAEPEQEAPPLVVEVPAAVVGEPTTSTEAVEPTLTEQSTTESLLEQSVDDSNESAPLEAEVVPDQAPVDEIQQSAPAPEPLPVPEPDVHVVVVDFLPDPAAEERAVDVEEVVSQPQQNEEQWSAVDDEVEEEQWGSLDGHEISEGVYIDPPPAIFMAFNAPDCPDVCLFNQPTSSRSPSPGHTDTQHQVFELLLHQLPTLYYEPLVSVFAALRQEEYLARIPQLAESELILDAYDLQLTISEDNIYAREVSLHDLNVLHDASNISGPLRLRLNPVSPRFIVRYHALQAHIARLTMADVDAEEQEPLPGDIEPQVQETVEDQHPQEADNAASLQPSVHVELNEDSQPTEAASTALLPEREESEQETADDVDEEPQVDVHETHGENPEQDGVDDAVEEVEPPEGEAVELSTTSTEPEAPPRASSPQVEHDSQAGPSNLSTIPAEEEDAPAANDDSADASHDVSYVEEEEEEWDEGGEGDPDTTWDADAEQETLSTQSSVTMSSKGSKRSIDEVETEDDELDPTLPGSPGSKRTRVE